MEEQYRNHNEIEIDLLEIAGLLLRKLKVLILFLVLGGLIAGCVTRFMITPQYTGTSMIFILTKTTSVTSLADIQLGSELTTDFTMLATSRPTLEKVIDELGLSCSPNELQSMVSVSNPADTRILKFDVTSPDPGQAADISNALANATADAVADIMNTDRPSLVEKAEVPDAPSSPNLMKNTMMGALCGLVLAVAVVIIRFLMDDTIKDEDDVTRYLNLNTLAALPAEGKADLAGSRKNKKGHA